MTEHLIGWYVAACFALLPALPPPVHGSGESSEIAGAMPGSAKAVVEASGVEGGLVVVVGCDDPAFLADLRESGPYLVHALDSDETKVASAREHLRRRGLYGPVTVSRLRSAELPYVDGLVNLIVLRADTHIAANEITRALAPGGVVVDVRDSKTKVTRKAWPAELDEWAHFLYDASNNAVSKDTRVDPPQGLRWTCGPEYARSHEHFASMSAMVTAGGRIFTIIDEGPISSVFLPPRWMLVARDAFSGVLLWKRPVTNWESHLRGFRSGPPEIGRVIVAKGDRLYASLGYGRPVTVLDAATGKELATLNDTDGARELLLTDGMLYVLADDITAERHAERRKWINGTSPTLEWWYRFPRKAIDMYGKQRIVAVKAATGKALWTRQFETTGQVMPTTMAAGDSRLCLQTVSHVVCLDAAGGKELWRASRPVPRSRLSWSTPSLVINDGVVLTIDRMASDNADKSPPAKGSKWLISGGGREIRVDAELVAFSLDDGKELWRAPYMENYNVPQDIFVIDGVVWVGNVRRGVDKGFTEGRDLKTGKVVRTIPPQKGWGHHRCYRNKATVRWIIMGRGGTQFVNLKDGTNNMRASWVRGGCQYGVMPANGLLYAPSHSCACSPKGFLAGFTALASTSSAGEGPPPLVKGPAYSEVPPRSAVRHPQSDWPTYRGNARRSSFQDLPAPARPAIAWTQKLASPVSAPVAVGGMVVLAETDRHAVRALSAGSGRPVWTFLADGRIDSPPTLAEGLCVFGTRNGFVYCLRASDGALVWRFRAAARDRRVFAYEQLESVWPVHGAVLVDSRRSTGQARVYFASGRSAFMDGGIRLYSLELKTGRVLAKTDIAMARGRHNAGTIRKMAQPDILSAENAAIWMRQLGVDKGLAPVEKAPHLFAPRGFLDATWWHRTYWVYGTDVGGGYTHWPDVGNVVPSGRMLAFSGDGLIYGYGRMVYRMGDGHVCPDMAKGYKLFAEALADAPVVEERPDGARRIKWTAQLPFVARSIVLTRDALLVAGGKSPTESADSLGPGSCWIVSRQDGSRMAACDLPAPPVLDGMAVTAAGVFISTVDGTIICLRADNGE